MNIVKNSDPEK